ncbi:MAG: cation:proton antiporter [Bradymonadaceae bacterium]|nr:cation:proton antiporter [Lujinxingiaceae bacterium]
MRHLLTMVILTTLMGIGHFLANSHGIAWSSAHTLVAVGFLVLVAFSIGEVFRRFGLPALLGYITVGVLFGPSLAAQLPFESPLAIITADVLADMRVVNVLVVGVIGMLAGGKFRISELAGNVRLLLVLTFAILVLVVPLTVVSVLALAQLFPQSLSFVADLPLASQVIVALFFGVIAFGLSPSTTVAVIQELRARGPLSTVVLGVVLLGEVVLFAVFALLLAVSRYVLGPEVVTFGLIASHVPIVFIDLALAILLGASVGILSVLYLTYVKKEPLLFTLVVIFVAYYAAWALGAEALLTFLVAGFFVQNASSQGDELVRSLERIGMPVFVVYFALVAAQLDLEAAAGYLPLVLGLIFARVVGLHFATRLAARKALETNRSYDFLHVTFLAQDAVVLVLAGVVAANFPGWGADFQNVIMATVIAYLIGGPILLKLALDRAGETQGARRRIIEEMEYRVEDSEGAVDLDLQAQLPDPDFADAWLRGRIEDLKEALIELDGQWVRTPLLEQRDHLLSFLAEVHTSFDEVVERLHTHLTAGQANDHLEAMPELVWELQKRLTSRLHPLLENLLAKPSVAVPASSMEAFLEAIRSLEDTQSIYKVEREQELVESRADDGRLLDFVKRLRRVRRRLRGPGYRSVPLGRLWRYYVELALPTSFARDTPQLAIQHELFWREMWRHLKLLDALFGDLNRALAAPAPEVAPDLVVPNDSDDDESLAAASTTIAAPTPKNARIKQHLDEFSATTQERHDELVDLLNRSTEVALHRYGRGVARAYTAFLGGAARAGTSELPAFRYRPATRFDQARRAEARITERLARQLNTVAGYRGWILLDHERALFVQWFQLYKMRVGRVAHSLVESRGQHELDELGARCQAATRQAGADWPAIFEEQLRPLLIAHRRTVENALSQLHQGVGTRVLIDIVEARVARLPMIIDVLAQESERTIVSASSFALPLRHWVVTRLSRELALRFVEFNERGGAILIAHLNALENVAQILEFNLLTAGRDRSSDASEANSFATNGLERAQKLVTQAQNQLRHDGAEFEAWIQREIDAIARATFSPLIERRLGEIQRELARFEASSFIARGENWASEYLRPLARRLRTTGEHTRGYWNEILADLRTMLGREEKIAQRIDIRERLYAGEPAVSSLAPSIYRRLFTPVPLDIPDFYVARPQIEQRCMEAIAQWFEGSQHSILITGNRGLGKRTLVHHLVPTGIYGVYSELADDQFMTIRLSEHIRTEGDLCRQLAPLLGGESEAVLDDLDSFAARLAERSGQRRIVIIENGEKIYTRTSAGLAMCRRFLRMVSSTSHHTLWIVVMGTPAATLLESMVGLHDYFTHSLAIEPLTSSEIEQMIMARHQVSGYMLDFQPRQLGRLQRLRRPFLGTTVRQPPSEFFELLTEQCHGNPHLALLYWLRAIALDPLDDMRISVMALHAQNLHLIDELSLIKKLILALLAQHGSLTPLQLHQVIHHSLDEIHVELEHLARLGFVEILAETLENYRLRALAAPLVTHELGQRNLI